jgi:hypothetical protein
MLTQERLKELVSYDQKTGIFTCNLVRHQSHEIGGELGYDTGRGYVRIKLDGSKYMAHRLAWLYVYGTWPADLLDHIDGDRKNNRIENLREASNSENLRNRPENKNNTSGHKGVYWNKQHQKWLVKFVVGGVNHYLGLFEDFDEAARAYREAIDRIHGEFVYRLAA